MDNAIRVSVAELLEVRADGLYAPELLAVIVGACEHLQRSNKNGVFSVDYVFFAPNGKIEITPVSPTHVAEESVPPELRESIDEDDRSGVREAQMVWCLGDVVRQSCAQACTDSELFSLLNLMTVAQVSSRPTIAKLLQMAKNRCSSNGVEVNGVLKALYEELMGDLEELMDTDGAESTSGWSETNGHGSEHNHSQTITKTAIRHEESPPSTSNSDVDEDEGFPGYLPPLEEENNHKQATKVIRRESAASSNTAKSSLSDGTLSDRRSSTASDRTLPEPDRTPPAPRRPPPLAVVGHSKVSVESSIEPPTPTSTTGPSASSSQVESQLFPFMTHKKSTPEEREPESVEPPSPVQEEVVVERQPSPPPTPKAPASPKVLPPPAPKTTPPAPSPFDDDEEDEDENDLPPLRTDLAGSPKLVPKGSPFTAVSARKRSGATPPSPVLNAPPPPPPETLPKEDASVHLSRHNSLEPGRVRRSSSRVGVQSRKSFASPEFVDKQSLAVIRLQAQSPRKKRLSLTRVESTFVLVKVIHGQTVEVNCRSDAYVGSVFDTVVDHFNVTEHNFFGLAVVRDNEFFFLDNEQRLEKYAPPGWKNARKSQQERYLLHLRFRYYPKKLDFIKTQATTHSLYLQLRQDVLNDTLKPSRDGTFQLGALALQAEFGDRPGVKLGRQVAYFQSKNYLPSRSYLDQDSTRIESLLGEIHSHYAGLDSVQAERQFVELCQSETEYGAHYYRVHKFKPCSHTTSNRYDDIHWIAVLPDGVGICNQQGSFQTSFVVMNSFHPWHMIRTLQFDRKRFLIATIENNVAQDHVFYTDHYTKSGYLVRFAASQHKFMLKMRQWQHTLSKERPVGKDVGVERGPADVEALFPKVSAVRTTPEHQEDQRHDTMASTTNATESEEDDDGPQRIQLKIVLDKDPATGLGLTLVDGVVDDVKGVYVKSVSSDGDARRKGVEKGDCIQAVNGVSLVDKSRHYAVELVKASGAQVELSILRFPYIAQFLGHERQGSKEEAPPPAVAVPAISTTSPVNGRKAPPSKAELLTGKRPSVSRTPPASRRGTGLAPNSRQRAASDFGTIGDTLPVLNSEDLLASLGKPRTRSSSESDGEGSGDEARRGEYRLPVTSIYNFHASDDDDDDAKADPQPKPYDPETPPPVDDTTSWVSKGTHDSAAQRSVQSTTYSQRQNLDWTNELSDIEDTDREGNGFGSSMQRITVTLHRLGAKSLGFQVATAAGYVYVKAVNAEPALSADLQVNDRIVSINGRPCANMSHQDVVENFKTDRSPAIQLVVERERAPAEREQTLSVTLEKSHNSSLGLSLAKRMGHEGIFVRNIATGSVAERDGRLRVGDRVWAVDGDEVGDEGTNAIVERLRAIEDRFVEIVVKRTLE